MKKDIATEITNSFINALQNDNAPWLRPWKQNGRAANNMIPHNAATGRAYNGINTMLLWMYGTQYATQGWLTYNQAKTLGGHVKKGEFGTSIVFWSMFEKTDEKGNKQNIPFIKSHTVFNIDQCEIDPAKLRALTSPTVDETAITALAATAGANVQHGGDKAFYRMTSDHIQMPNQEQFDSLNSYNGTLAHELTHWTGHASRCNREFGKRFGDDAYAFEELVAEIGSAFICAHTGIELKELQHTQYVNSWIKVLKNDKKAIIHAASKAKEAMEYIIGKDEDLTE